MYQEYEVRYILIYNVVFTLLLVEIKKYYSYTM